MQPSEYLAALWHIITELREFFKFVFGFMIKGLYNFENPIRTLVDYVIWIFSLFMLIKKWVKRCH